MENKFTIEKSEPFMDVHRHDFDRKGRQNVRNRSVGFGRLEIGARSKHEGQQTNDQKVIGSFTAVYLVGAVGQRAQRYADDVVDLTPKLYISDVSILAA